MWEKIQINIQIVGVLLAILKKVNSIYTHLYKSLDKSDHKDDDSAVLHCKRQDHETRPAYEYGSAKNSKRKRKSDFE